MKHLTTVPFRLLKSRIFGFVPGWLALILVLGGMAAASPVVFNGRVAPMVTVSPTDSPTPGTLALVSGPKGSSYAYFANGDGTWNPLTYQTSGANNPRDFGAKCDGTTDDSAVFNTFSHFPIYVNYGNCYLNESVFSLATQWSGRIYGGGKIQTVQSAVTTSQAPDLSFINSTPTTGSNYSENGFNTAFAADFSKTHLAWASLIQGTATLGQPTSGYLFTPTTSGVYAFFQNASGWNQDTGDNIGRTGATAYRTKVLNSGQGDAIAYDCTGFVSGANKGGATSFLANPAVVCFGGDVNAGIAGDYLNPFEVALNDNGYDSSGVGAVYNLNRTNNTAALGAIWEGVDVQATNGATKNIDAAFAARGDINIGMDLTGMQSPTAAIAFAANNCIYPNATNSNNPKYARYTALGNTSLCYNSVTSAYEITVGAGLGLQVVNGGIQVPSGACTGGVKVGAVYVYSSTGVPACTAPNGSLFLRSDGTSGARMYVSAGAGTWAAVAGV